MVELKKKGGIAVKDRFEYTSICRTNVKKAVFFICASVITSMLLGIASVENSIFSPYLSIISLVFLLLSIMISVRFVGMRYLYKLTLYPFDDGDLVITELRGCFGRAVDVKVKRTVCRVSVKTIVDICEIRQSDDNKKIKDIKKTARMERAAIYNYTTEFFPNEYVVLKIKDVEGVSYVNFSPDKELLRLLRDCKFE